MGFMRSTIWVAINLVVVVVAVDMVVVAATLMVALALGGLPAVMYSDA